MPHSFITFLSFRVPPKSIECCFIISLAWILFLVVNFVPLTWPICFPFSLAVSIPSRVLWRRSSTSFSDWLKAIFICSLASSNRYLFIPSSIKSTLVPVGCNWLLVRAFLYVAVLIWGSFKNTNSIPWLYNFSYSSNLHRKFYSFLKHYQRQ